MFKALYNRAELQITLRPKGPLVIRAGRQARDPVRPDTMVLRTITPDGETVYIPGSTLKGVFRAHAERILIASDKLVRDPFDHQLRKPIAKDLKDTDPIACQQIYGRSCLADRCFGSTEIAGRIRIGDAYPSKASWKTANQTEVRDGVGIDRKTQCAARGVKYDFEAVTQGDFETEVLIENFELWQLALFLQCLSDLDEGLVQVGGLKSRGAGSMSLVAFQLRYSHTSQQARICGVSSFIQDEEQRHRGLGMETPVAVAADFARRGFWNRCELEGVDAMRALIDAIAEHNWPPQARVLEV